MDERELSRWLREIAEEGIPRSPDLWPAIRERIASPASRKARRWRSGGWLAWGIPLLLMALAIGAVASAGDLWESFVLSRGPKEGLSVQLLHLEQEQGGYRVLLEWAYADWNAIRIGYRVQGPLDPGQRAALSEVLLSDEAGRSFPPEMEEGVLGASEAMRMALPPGEQASILSFESWAHAPLPDLLRLRLRLRLAIDLPSGVREERGPFAFDFRIPVHPGVIREDRQTAVANGVAVTMERAVIAPSGVRARICFPPPDPRRIWRPLPDGGAVREEGDGCFRVFFFPRPGVAAPAPGALRILELIGVDPRGQDEPLRLPGPWVFPLDLSGSEAPSRRSSGMPDAHFSDHRPRHPVFGGDPYPFRPDGVQELSGTSIRL